MIAGFIAPSPPSCRGVARDLRSLSTGPGRCLQRVSDLWLAYDMSQVDVPAAVWTSTHPHLRTLELCCKGKFCGVRRSTACPTNVRSLLRVNVVNRAKSDIQVGFSDDV